MPSKIQFIDLFMQTRTGLMLIPVMSLVILDILTNNVHLQYNNYFMLFLISFL